MSGGLGQRCRSVSVLIIPTSTEWAHVHSRVYSETPSPIDNSKQGLKPVWFLNRCVWCANGGEKGGRWTADCSNSSSRGGGGVESGAVSIMRAQWVGVLAFVAVLTIGSQWNSTSSFIPTLLLPPPSPSLSPLFVTTALRRERLPWLGPCQLHEHRRCMEKMTWHVNTPLWMCHIVHTATTHAVIAVHNSAAAIVTPANHCHVTASPTATLGDDYGT
ncbi:uncharacterized protein LACBIDRAFT_333623 [Laccaria bicolor S238N-H82]|uniref:Predicted protein n=1 Tax=Laccaria bicolor (strain S238N-H82 / ATCC MYA-4686) TaxID=486041 RepID=B0DWJ4_LACBS|nr:uncharacterized protein LACBIDRAFT_333623 [Laccaria bicolor S238N-H82]EDR01058.1 predicted protein [Laccaria bicolor S238N-H82]|eukprot:XP_001888277.1 predicted protein [Laccaria bicolor S238N-H82]